MNFLLDPTASQNVDLDAIYSLTALQRSYGCRCHSTVFFLNSHCLRCDTPLGYEPHVGHVFSLAPGTEPDSWQLAGPNVPDGHTSLYRRCENLNSPAACNWLVPVDGSNHSFCLACRLNRMIPNMSVREDAALWGRVEAAKRRVISAVVALGLPVQSRVTDDPRRGLAFDFIRSLSNGARAMTGHEDGLITLNIEEADDVKREQMRTSMHEPYRTLVGHFRHEIGHYYWDRLVSGSHWLSRFRELFGDERFDYDEALKNHYANGPKPGWELQHISSYAGAHPWEDWAETWAHYLHMIDTLGTATSFGVQPEMMSMPFDCFGTDTLCTPESPEGRQFLKLVNNWLKLSSVVNELNRSMGQPDFYPFAMPRAVVRKLHLVHLVVREKRLATREKQGYADRRGLCCQHPTTSLTGITGCASPLSGAA